MLDDRPQAGRILVAQLTREARHRARWRELTGDEEATAVAGLRGARGWPGRLARRGRRDLRGDVRRGTGRTAGTPGRLVVPQGRRGRGGDPGAGGRGPAPKGRREAAPAVRRSARRGSSTAPGVPGWRRHVIMRRAEGTAARRKTPCSVRLTVQAASLAARPAVAVSSHGQLDLGVRSPTLLSEIMRRSQVPPRAPFPQDGRRVIRGNGLLPLITAPRTSVGPRRPAPSPSEPALLPAT